MHDIQLLFTVDNSQMLGTNCKRFLCDESLTFEFADRVDYNIRDDQSGQSQADITAHSRCKLYDLLETDINLIFSNFGLTTRKKNTKRHKHFIIQAAYTTFFNILNNVFCDSLLFTRHETKMLFTLII